MGHWEWDEGAGAAEGGAWKGQGVWVGVRQYLGWGDWGWGGRVGVKGGALGWGGGWGSLGGGLGWAGAGLGWGRAGGWVGQGQGGA